MSDTAGSQGSDSADTGGRQRRNHALWLGPLIAIPGFVSYWAVFARWPLFRDVPWANLLILGAAVWLSALGLRRAWSGGGLRRSAGILGVAVSGGLTGLLLFYCFVLSNRLPDASLAAGQGASLPAITLVADDGSSVDLGEAGQGPLILVFYRGHW